MSGSNSREPLQEGQRPGLLIDESAGRAEARRRKLRVTGTLGVLRAGAELGLVDVPKLITRLKTTCFYVDDALVTAIFQRWLKP
jgi:predicted nucleic acid-binding protein